jgi:hypothetical protein
MALIPFTRRGAVALVAAIATVVLVPSTASARWRFHNDADVTQISAPPGGTEDQTCTNLLKGQTGWAVDPGGDPNTYPVPDIAYQAVTYDVWTKPSDAPAGGQITFRDPDVEYLLPDGTTVPAVFVKQFTTSDRVAVTPPITTPALSPNYLFTRGHFSTSLPPGIAPGDPVGIKPTASGSEFITLTAVDCTRVAVRIDVRPDSSANNVDPRRSSPLLPVLVYGSSTFDVRSIAAVHLQNAAPKSVSPELRRPYDANGDGYLDRRYYFAPSATGIRCGQTSVTLTGRTSAGLRFTGTDAIHTVC